MKDFCCAQRTVFEAWTSIIVALGGSTLLRRLLPSWTCSMEACFCCFSPPALKRNYKNNEDFHFESFLNHQTFSLRSNDWKSCSLERTALHPVPNSSKTARFTQSASCRQIGYAASAEASFLVVEMPVYLR